MEDSDYSPSELATYFEEENSSLRTAKAKTWTEIQRDLNLAIHAPALVGLDKRIEALKREFGLTERSTKPAPARQPTYFGSFVEED